ncbi:hypothetical protein [Streptomyces sp. NBC_01549]|uniref:hypothetical protein n=1 Tax=Streptomyces sp. NBC_01549 TaxID=2975874 RepID=UPI002B1CC50D|nr:hypothetical protein [Streptomyces sp. NBC_01549]
MSAQPAGVVRRTPGQQVGVEDVGPVDLFFLGEQVEQQGPSLVRFSPAATNRLRGLCRLLPLPCANTTTPIESSGTVNCPRVTVAPARTSTSRSSGTA